MAHLIDWGDPEARDRLQREIGRKAFGAALEEHQKSEPLEVVNGYSIRPVRSRFGTLYAVDGAMCAFATPEQARRHAEKLRAKGAKMEAREARRGKS